MHELSLSGSGEISFYEKEHKKLNFSFFSQNDSSIIFFKDIFGRKFLILGVLENSIFVKDIFNNRFYNYDFIKNYYPNVIFFESNILNKFLTNKLDYINENIDKNMIFDKESFSFEIKEKDHQKLFDYLEIKSNSLKISVYINERNFNKEKKNLIKIWSNFKN